MRESILFVVGDEYERFGESTEVITVSDLLVRISENALEPIKFRKIVVGQGIERSTRMKLVQTLSNLGFACLDNQTTIIDARLTHKSDAKNVLISEPTKIEDNAYEFQFSVGHEVDRLSDHVTGQHIGAMLLMESARQAVIVTIEKFYERDSIGDFGFVLDEFTASFNNYVFPLPVTIRMTLEEVERKPKHLSVILVAGFLQGGSTVSTMRLDVNLYPKSILKKIEKSRASAAIRECAKRIFDSETSDLVTLELEV